MLPEALTNAIDALGALPGVGSRTAERYATYLLKQPENVSRKLISALSNLHSGVKICPVTFAFMNEDDEFSPLYTESSRDRSVVLVVEEPLDIYALERTKNYSGTYHVLGGALSPIDGITPDKLHVGELIERVRKDGVKEIIIATNPSVEGESTAIFLTKIIKDTFREDGPDSKVTITRLARGLPLGISLEYADQVTLSAALNGRTSL